MVGSAQMVNSLFVLLALSNNVNIGLAVTVFFVVHAMASTQSLRTCLGTNVHIQRELETLKFVYIIAVVTIPRIINVLA